MNDLPNFTEHEKRAMYYIQGINQGRSEPANLATLARESDWESKYFTRAWKRLKPRGLVKVHSKGNSTELELTEAGNKVVNLLLEINKVMPK